MAKTPTTTPTATPTTATAGDAPATTATTATTSDKGKVDRSRLVDVAGTKLTATRDFQRGNLSAEKGKAVPAEMLAGLTHGDIIDMRDVAGVIKIDKLA